MKVAKCRDLKLTRSHNFEETRWGDNGGGVVNITSPIIYTC